MTVKIKILFLAFFVIFFASSCKKDAYTSPNKSSIDNFSALFDEFYNKMNTNYVFWDIDKTNWNKIYKEYYPLFRSLDLNSAEDKAKSIDYFKEITDSLLDSHYSISFTYIGLRPTSFSPSTNRKEHEKNFHSPFLYYGIDSVYLDKGFVAGNYINQQNQSVFAMSGMINSKILYFTSNQFSLVEAFYAKKSNGVKTVLDYFFTKLVGSSIYLKGVIIDVRNNPGGDITDLNFLVSHLIDKPLKFGYTKYKTANGRLDYTPWINSVINPFYLQSKIDIPMVVIADNYSKSTAELLTMAIRATPHGVFVGERTWGATGPLADNSIYNSGSFAISNLLTIYCSSAQFKYIDGNSYEGTGFPPDKQVIFDLTSLKKGKDNFLEEAILQLK